MERGDTTHELEVEMHRNADRGSANDPNEFLDEISHVGQLRHSDSEYAL